MSPWLLTLTLMVTSYSSQTQCEDPGAFIELNLKQGRIRGQRHSIGESRFYYSFRGIPYAQPPIGELRFKNPVPASPWTGLREETDPPPCPQLIVGISLLKSNGITGEEDCLYLNVYSPQPRDAEFPVMVFIHGGGMKFGSADMMGGTPQRLLVKNIVLVSLQYRLGTLGFLSTGDATLPGNLGLRDQTLALQWVKKNIRNFGGDPKRVTIFGQSAGAVSAHFQMLTPYAKGLFNQVIVHSGTAINPWATRKDHASVATKIARSLCYPGVSGNPINSTEILACLQGASVEALVRATEPYTNYGFPFYMVPRVDGDYIPAQPARLLKEGKYQRVNIMAGVCQNEVTVIVNEIMNTNQTEDRDFMETFVTNHLPMFLGMEAEDDLKFLTRRAFYHYMDDIQITETNVNHFEQLLSDGFMVMLQDEACALHARDAPFGKSVYRYELQHRGERSFSNATFGKQWVAHGDDLPYLFDGIFDLPPVSRSNDQFLSDIMVTLWTNFASTGNPTPDLQLGFKWEAMTSPSDFKYLSLTPDPKMRDDSRKQRREFWRNLPLKKNKILFPERFRKLSNVQPAQ
ncbi:neuroligin-4, X-linked-like [Macrobrachium nipponense]|uniref:neuroligin-4, X-linked-like n=1 Tax=Macrobrachium nipponense TaxID=159736 RepID=UPI0030C8C9B9